MQQRQFEPAVIPADQWWWSAARPLSVLEGSGNWQHLVYKSGVCSLWEESGRNHKRLPIVMFVHYVAKQLSRKSRAVICRCCISPVASQTEPGPPCSWFCSLCGPSACFGSSDHVKPICYSVLGPGRERIAPANKIIFFMKQSVSKVQSG